MSHYRPYPAYKDSGVEWLGAVPKEWEVKRLRYAASLNPPVKAGLQPDAEVSFLPMEAIGADGSISLENTRPIAEVRNGYSYFEDGDVTFAKVTPCFENGKGAVMRGLIGGIGFGTTELTVLRSNPHSDVNFINYLLQSDRFRLLGAGAMTGAGGLKRVPDEFTRNFEAPWPVLDEQHAIAVHLDRETARIDGLIGKKTRFIELLREKRQALITHAVTKGLDPSVKMKDSGVEWLGEVPEHWDVWRIKYVSETISKGTTPTTIGEQFVDEGVRFLKAENIFESKVQEQPEFYISEEAHHVLSRSSLQEWDVLVVIAGATTGKSAILGGHLLPANTNQAVSFIRPFKILFSEFINFLLGTTFVISFIDLNSVQSAQPNLSMEDLGNIPLPMPPINEVTDIVSFLKEETTRIDTLISKTETSIALLKERRSALITAAVTGRIDLRDAA